MMANKTVSVVMCTYNGEEFLRQQLDSIIGQSYPIGELIVQDDASTDGTQRILREYCSQYPIIKLFINKERLGYNHNFLSAMQKATGEAIALADQDDIWHKEKIMKQMGKLDEGFLLTFHNSYLFKDTPETIIRKRYNETPVMSELCLALKPFIPGHECLFSGEILNVIKQMYEQEEHISFDSIIALICFTLGEVAYLDEGLVYWRRHSKATTYTGKQRTDSNVIGMMKSVFSLTQAENKAIINRYFNVVGVLPFKTEAMRKIARLLQQGNWQFIKACFICSRYPFAFFNKPSLRNKVKATFTPLHLLRDGTFLVK